ncbi:hypothetical protein AK812_SmicGene9982 [Symbiodinium microadriaticum]|uniref:Uncharacterized protein n=1 Tax=Symbiodinium microadriaticum TaxID=2951 RepID=A0A1Q9EH00_SYMMI|nr:hypothetical protein AK812_SmicGene9982 [Symbiodinium microadriaticum]
MTRSLVILSTSSFVGAATLAAPQAAFAEDGAVWIPALSAIGAGFAIGLAAIGSGVGQDALSKSHSQRSSADLQLLGGAHGRELLAAKSLKTVRGTDMTTRQRYLQALESYLTSVAKNPDTFQTRVEKRREELLFVDE